MADGLLFTIILIICPEFVCSKNEHNLFHIFITFCQRLSRTNFYKGSEEDFEVSRDDCQSDGYYDDDKQPICQDGRRSPRRSFLPSPQGERLHFIVIIIFKLFNMYITFNTPICVRAFQMNLIVMSVKNVL